VPEPDYDSIDWEVVQIEMKGPDMPYGIHLDHESLDLKSLDLESALYVGEQCQVDLESALYVGEQCLVMK